MGYVCYVLLFILNTTFFLTKAAILECKRLRCYEVGLPHNVRENNLEKLNKKKIIMVSSLEFAN